MKKVVPLLVIILLVIVSIVFFSACKSKSAESLQFDTSYVFSETKLISEISKIKNNNVKLAENGESDFVVAYPDEVDDIGFDEKGYFLSKDRYKVELKNSAKFLAGALKTITGNDFILVKLSQITNNTKAIKLVLNENLIGVTKQGYSLTIKENEILIEGVFLQGITNGIYSFLEDKLGCMFLSKEYDYFPYSPTINLEGGTTIYNPPIQWRNIHSHEVIRFDWDGKKASNYRNDINYLGLHTKLKLNGAGQDDWGTWVHNFYDFIPPEEYYHDHPEYFSQYGGVRKTFDIFCPGQLCLTNPDVYDIVSTKLFKMMEEKPDIHIWDFSQMDSWEIYGTGCRCKECKKIDNEEGSFSGSLLTFINRLADECAERFPDNYISTLAYNYSAKPPKNIKPRDNVIIKLCLMPGDNASDIANPRSKEAKDSKDLIIAWSKVAKHILIWDYQIGFHDYLMPYPILTPLKSNNDFFIDNNIIGIFHQMDWEKGGDNAVLNSYVFAKLMWDRNTDVKETVQKFLSVYYGPAAKYISQYLNLLNQNIYKANKRLYLYDSTNNHILDYLSIANINKYLKLFEKAEESVKGNQELTNRVQKAKLSVIYAKANQFSFDIKGRLKALKEFKYLCDKYGIITLTEQKKHSDNQVELFYRAELIEIKCIPLIAIAMVVGTYVFIWCIVFIAKYTKKRNRVKEIKRYRKLNK